jgi:hypothetical protein
MTEKYEWQYNGAAPMRDILEWCQANLGEHWFNGYETIYFYDRESYTYFLLRWI